MQFEIGLFVGAFFAALITSLSWFIDDQPDELEQEQALYCEMVATHKATGGEYGWPDYRGVYERACK